MLKKGGPINGKEFAKTWFNYRLMTEGAAEYEPTLSWPGPQRAYAREMASLERLSHLANQKRPCFSGWDSPMGIIHAGDPVAAADSGYAMAVAIATALTPGTTMEDIIENVLSYAWTLGHHAVNSRAVGSTNGNQPNCSTPFDLYESFYHEFLVTFPPWDSVFTLEMVPCALAICAIAGEDTEQAIIGATNVGRDADTIAGIAGELAGALYGFDALPAQWANRVIEANPSPDLEQMAKDLTNLVVERNKVKLERSSVLLSDLEG